MTPLESIEKLTKDLKMAAEVLPVAEARFLVDAYYQMQDARIRSAGQIRSIIQDKHSEAREPHELLTWFFEQNSILENQIRSALDKYTGAHVMGDWMRSIKGIGPVISAGMLAHIDIEKAPTVGHIWSFAGLVDGVEWTKGQKRPWNAQLKTLCWKAGESFVKVSGRDDAFYGRIYAERKKQEMARNEAGDFAGQARAKLEKFKIGKNTDAYAAYSIGKLPPGHIHARAKRYTVKLFLSHLHHVWYEIHFGIAPPNPYPIAHMGHAHMIPPPMKP